MLYNVVVTSAVQQILKVIHIYMGFLEDSMVKNLPAKQETGVPSPGWEDSPGERDGKPLQYSCLGNTMDKRAWQAAVQGVTKKLDTTQQLNNSNHPHTHTHIHTYIYIYIHIYIYVHPLFLGFTSYLGHHRTLSSIPCAVQYVIMCACMLSHFSLV